jgi:hypothetical protein
MSMTELFSETHALLAQINPASYAAEQNTGYVSLANYHRAVIIIHAGVLGGDLDVDIEEATSTAGTGAQSFDAGGKDVTVHNADDNLVHVIEINADELDITDGYKCINVEATPGAGSIFGVQIWGTVPRFAPVSTTGLNGVTD